MSIKIDGTNNTISKIKDDYTNSVKVYNDLYVNGEKVDPKGETSTNYVTIDSNGVEDLAPYGTNTVFKIRVTNYEDMSNTKKEDGYYEVTSNNSDINIADLTGYTHLFVNIANPNPDDPEDPDDPTEPDDPEEPDEPVEEKLVEEIKYVSMGEGYIYDTQQSIALIEKRKLNNKIDLKNYDVNVTVTPKIQLESYFREDITEE
jgi:hypothetical protein